MNTRTLTASSPSRWSRRIVLAALAIAGCVIASYLASYQLGISSSVWDPFSSGSPRVLHSELERLLPVPDALLGAVAYAVEAVLDLLGGSDRWRKRPWLVLLFGLVVAGLAATALTLIAVQLFLVGALCTLCLTSALISLVVAGIAFEEVRAAFGFLRGRQSTDRKESNMTEQTNAAHGSVGSFGSNGGSQRASTQPGGPDVARPDGPDVDGGNEQLWRQPDASITPHDHQGVAVVTGAAAGLGRAIVREFAKHGYDIGLIARDEGSLENAKAEVESVGRRAVICAIDVADADAVEHAADRIEGELGPIDVWVNDAMVSVFSPVKEMEAEGYKRVTEVNYLGYVYGTLAALKRMLPRDRGHIVHVGSALAYRSIPLQSAYCASKHAILGFHVSLRTELMHDHSHVVTTMVQMPALNTPQFDWVKSRLPNKPQPVPPIYDPEVGAEAVYWAAHHDRREVVVGSSTWGAINANKLVPSLLDWYLSKTGYKSQQTPQPDDPNRPNDVWKAVPGDRGAHGRFDSRSKTSSKQVWATTHRGLVASAVGAAGLAVLGAVQILSGRRD